MQSLFFWKNCHSEYRVLWIALMIAFVGGLIFLWYGYVQGPGALVQWDKYQNQKTIEGVTHVFEAGNFEFAVPIESYLTLEYFHGGALKPNTTASYIFVVMLIACSLVLFTVISTLPKFWYYVGTGLFILYIVSLRLEVLELFGVRNQLTTLATVCAYVGLSFYFNAFFKSASFTFRLVAFTLLAIILGVLIYFFASVDSPFLYLSVSGYIPGLILSVLFILMIAHEIVASFVFLTSQSSTSSKSLMHFMVISLIYLINLVITYMHEAGLIQWNFIYINLYLLVSISAVLSIWGYKSREALYENITRFSPFGAFFIITLAIITFSTIGMLLTTHNDAALKIIRDGIVFSHIGFGAIFLLYFISNFIGLMAANRNVYKVLYTPTRMPYATYRIAGLIATLAFMFYSNWHTYVYNATAGIFNSMANLQLHMNNVDDAEAYYKKARVYAVSNFTGNYVLANLETQRNNFDQAHSYYNSINWQNPNEFSWVNDANLFVLQDNYFYSAFTLEKALSKTPNSSVIKNNLGVSYTKLQVNDSAFLMFDQARNSRFTKESAEINITGLLAQNEVDINIDSVVQTFTPSDATLSNAVLLAGRQQKSLTTTIDPLKKQTLDLYSATLLNNYIVYKLTDLDTAFTNKAFKIASDSVNSDFTEALKATLSHSYYHQNNVAKAMALMGEVAYITQSMQGKFNYTLGLWALEQGNPALAVKCFAYAVEQNYKDARTYNAIALAEAHLPEEALDAAKVLLESKTLSDRTIGEQLKKALTISHDEVLKQTDLDKYQYCRYRLGLADSVKFNQVVARIENSNYKTLMLLEMAQRHFDAGSTRNAIRYFNKLDGIRFTDKNLNDKINHFELELLASRNEFRLLGAKINEGITFPQNKQLQKMLYTALISEASGDTLTAQKNYEVLAVYNPFFEEGVIAAARYFSAHGTDNQKAYTILTEAKHINPGSVRLLMAYITEAKRIGFDDFAADAFEELEALRKTQR